MSRRRFVVGAAAAALLTAACSTTPPPEKTVTTANPVRSAADLSCSLPVKERDRFGFIDFPSGRFRVDTSAPAPQPNQGYLYAHGARQWVLTHYAFAEYQLSPDETQLAALEAPSGNARLSTGISLVDLKTSRARHLATLPGPAVRILGFLPDGIYVFGFSIYRVDPATGEVTVIKPEPPEAVTNGLWFWVTPYAAWSSLISGQNQSDKDSVLSIALSDGSVTTWYTAPATRSVSILGFVAPDKPLVAEYNTEPFDRMTGVSFMLLRKPGIAETLNFDPSIVAWGISDSFGVWLSSPGHLWLYDAAGQFLMADVPSDFTGIAGFCR